MGSVTVGAMVTKRLFLLAIGIGVTACLCSAQSIENATVEREEYAVYSAMIPEVYGDEESRFMVIANPTSNWPYQISKKDFQFFYPTPVVSQETLDDFLSRTKTNRWLTRKFDVKVDYVLTDYEEIERLIGISHPFDDWKLFFKQYPAAHGFIHFSRVGFDHYMNQALVFAGWRCPGLCGQWEFILMEKSNHVWKVVNRANREVS
jgi:hypothetical protein